MAHIVFTLEDGTEIETELDSDVITIGRHSDSIVELPSASVSSHHATIKRRKDSFYVQDLGTTNGTKLNGVEVEEAKLEDGDQLCFGDIPAVVHLKEASDKKEAVVAATAVKKQTGEVEEHELPQRGDSKKGAAKKSAAAAGGRRPMPAKRGSIPQYKETVGCAGFVAFLSFLALTFLIGLHLRHAAETGGFLAGDILKKLRDGVGEQGAAPNVDDKAPAKKKKKAKDDTKTEEAAPAATPAPAANPAAPAMMDAK
ncbi:hypothetical protein BH11VER1_BH11VER1_31990 [soil metagenome]